MGIHDILQTQSTEQGIGIRTDFFARDKFQDWEASGKKAAAAWEI